MISQTSKVSQIQTRETFNDTINMDSISVIDFYADWCGPCQVIAPRFERMAAKINSVNFYKLNIETDKCREIAQEFRISSIPTFLVFKNGKQIGRLNSMLELETLLETEKVN